jgi:hypothetical protein
MVKSSKNVGSYGRAALNRSAVRINFSQTQVGAGRQRSQPRGSRRPINIANDPIRHHLPYSPPLHPLSGKLNFAIDCAFSHSQNHTEFAISLMSRK